MKELFLQKYWKLRHATFCSSIYFSTGFYTFQSPQTGVVLTGTLWNIQGFIIIYDKVAFCYPGFFDFPKYFVSMWASIKIIFL